MAEPLKAKVKFKWSPTVKKRRDQAILDGMNQSMLIMSRALRRILSKPGTGRLYAVAGKSAAKARKRGGMLNPKGTGPRYKQARNLRAGGYHRASAPEFPPAVNTNRLRGSFVVQMSSSADGFSEIVNDKDQKKFVLNYGSKVTYAPMLEYGTRKMAKRPYIAPVLEFMSAQVEKIFAKAFYDQFTLSDSDVGIEEEEATE